MLDQKANIPESKQVLTKQLLIERINEPKYKDQVVSVLVSKNNAKRFQAIVAENTPYDSKTEKKTILIDYYYPKVILIY